MNNKGDLSSVNCPNGHSSVMFGFRSADCSGDRASQRGDSTAEVKTSYIQVSVFEMCLIKSILHLSLLSTCLPPPPAHRAVVYVTCDLSVLVLIR